jgi:hypothetical protein
MDGMFLLTKQQAIRQVEGSNSVDSAKTARVEEAVGEVHSGKADKEDMGIVTQVVQEGIIPLLDLVCISLFLGLAVEAEMVGVRVDVVGGMVVEDIDSQVTSINMGHQVHIVVHQHHTSLSTRTLTSGFLVLRLCILNHNRDIIPLLLVPLTIFLRRSPRTDTPFRYHFLPPCHIQCTDRRHLLD